MHSHKNAEALVRDYYVQFQARERHAVLDMLAPDFTFTSPYDNAIDAHAYFAKCWKAQEHLKALEIQNLVVQGDDVFVRYLGTWDNGDQWRNVEVFGLDNGRIRSLEVYFGDTFDKESPVKAR